MRLILILIGIWFSASLLALGAASVAGGEKEEAFTYYQDGKTARGLCRVLILDLGNGVTRDVTWLDGRDDAMGSAGICTVRSRLMAVKPSRNLGSSLRRPRAQRLLGLARECRTLPVWRRVSRASSHRPSTVPGSLAGCPRRTFSTSVSSV